MYYHGADPDLVDVCSELFEDVTSKNILAFREHRPLFDFCLEDTWTYFFIQRQLAGDPEQRVDLLHLDDHSDMTPPLLSRSETGLIDIPLGIELEPGNGGSIETAISSGAIGIGNFLSPLFHHRANLRVSHLCNTDRVGAIEYEVVRECVEIPIVEGLSRIGVRHARPGEAGQNNSYVISSRVEDLIERMPGGEAGRLLVHVDLDYFINDYDGGNVQGVTAAQDAAAVEAARTKLRRFFEGMRLLGRPVERWIVATSPGFCGARHWGWLIDELSAGIEQLATSRGG